MARNLTAEERAARDDETAAVLAAHPDGITQYDLGRLLHPQPNGYGRYGTWNAEAARRLDRLVAQGRARCETERHPGPGGFRRVWYPVEEEL